MHQSHEPREVMDRYYTPEWLATKLVELLPFDHRLDYGLEPHVGAGAFIPAMAERCNHLTACDKDEEATGLNDDRVNSSRVGNFITTVTGENFDLIVGNPPFAGDTGRVSPKTGNPITRPIAIEHIEHALGQLSRGGIAAFLIPLAMLAGKSRSSFWQKHPPIHVWILPKRVRFSGKKGTSMQDYMWVCWRHGYAGPTGMTILPEGWQQ